MKTSETGGCQTKTVVFTFSKLAKTSPKTTSKTSPKPLAKTSPKPLAKTRFEFPYYSVYPATQDGKIGMTSVMEVFQADEVFTHLYLRELFHGVVKMLTKFHFTDWNVEIIVSVKFMEKEICMTCLQALMSLSPSEPDTCTQWFMNHSFRWATHFVSITLCTLPSRLQVHSPPPGQTMVPSLRS